MALRGVKVYEGRWLILTNMKNNVINDLRSKYNMSDNQFRMYNDHITDAYVLPKKIKVVVPRENYVRASHPVRQFIDFVQSKFDLADAA